MDPARLRAWYSHRQGLDGSLAGSTPAQVLDRSGWGRSIGGAAPYLALYARCGASREEIDAAVAALQIHELPAARGCTYVVPAADFAIALAAGHSFGAAEMKVAYKLGVTDPEIAKLCDAVVKALSKGPLDPDGIRKAVGSATRSLGPEGKAKGLTTTLPLALGELQSTGEIRRVPINGRLDHQRYQYTVWRPNPLKGYKLSAEQTATELARLYFKWAGPATLAQFREFSGFGVKVAKAAAEPLKLEPIESGADLLMLPGERDALDAFHPPKSPQYSLVSSLDAIGLLRGELDGWSGAGFLPHHIIVDRGLLVGFWEYDPAAHKIAWMPLGKKDKAMEAAVKRTEAFVREQLGDARMAALDSPASRVARIVELRSGR